jgi:sarcosine oxidase
MWDAIVVGTGIMGASSLASLAAAGLKVLGIDRFEPPHARGSSHGHTRVTRKAYFEDPRYVPLLEQSFVRYRSLEREVGRPLFQPTFGLYFGAPDHEGMIGVARAAREHALPHRAVSTSDLSSDFPLRLGPSDHAVREDEAGVLAAEPMVQAFLEVAEKYGAQRLSNVVVRALEPVAGGVRVHAGDERLQACRVVLAMGGWSADAALLPAIAPLVVERQVQLFFQPDNPSAFTCDRMPIFLRFGDPGALTFYGIPIVPRFGGRSAEAVKVCAHHGGALTTVEQIDREVHADDEALVIDFVTRHLPALGTRIVERQVCLYTNTPDEHFVVGPHPAMPRVVALAGFSGHGFKLAPAVGTLVRDLVMDEAGPHPLFDPKRFTDPVRGSDGRSPTR